MIVAIGDFGPNNFNHARSGFDQAASEQAALAKRVTPIAIAHFVRLFVQ
jgi:hypothetical protein